MNVPHGCGHSDRKPSPQFLMLQALLGVTSPTTGWYSGGRGALVTACRAGGLEASLHQMKLTHNQQQLQSEMRKRSLVSLPIGSTPTTLSLETGDYITFSGEDILRATNNFASENLLVRLPTGLPCPHPC